MILHQISICESFLVKKYIRFTGLVAVVGLSNLTRSDGCVVNKLEQMLAVACNDCQLLGVLTDCVELIIICSFQLFARNVRKLGFCHKRFGFGSD